ncbi:hypothetical protein [Methanogenium organophilum]|uniref:Uncharacterized protein n=1 Tax=Methanogenium organophilum TaxID=2199 RepID=A0A9X9S3T3_METOG|nr:hypothetical protein [Methanogenium organophilum]WAI01399.1 hypothetical protein OU421_00555 [Methanogenium organophilum]
MNNKKPVILIALVVITISVAMTLGCTENSGAGTVTTLTADAPKDANVPANQQNETEVNPAAENAAKSAYVILPEPVKLPGSITEDTAVMPEYDSETEENLLNDAKTEILRVFPKLSTSSLNNYHWGANLAGTFFVPVIVFEGVIVDTDEPDNVCKRVYYDPKKGRIVHWDYSTDAPIRDTSSGEIIRHEDVDIERDIIPIFKKMIGAEEYEKNKNNYFIYLADNGNMPLTTVAHIRETRNGVKSYMGNTQIYFSRATGEVVVYGDRFNDEEFFKKSVTLSPVPEISFEEAKAILEAKLDELYPDDPQNIEYSSEGECTNCLFWMDRTQFLNLKGDYNTSPNYIMSPIPLAWGILFKTEESRSYGDRDIWAAIDANSGEILSLYNSKIKIFGKNYD